MKCPAMHRPDILLGMMVSSSRTSISQKRALSSGQNISVRSFCRSLKQTRHKFRERSGKGVEGRTLCKACCQCQPQTAQRSGQLVQNAPRPRSCHRISCRIPLSWQCIPACFQSSKLKIHICTDVVVTHAAKTEHAHAEAPHLLHNV